MFVASIVCASALRLRPTAAIFEPSIRTSALSKSPSVRSSVRPRPPLSNTRFVPPVRMAPAWPAALSPGDDIIAAASPAALDLRKSRRLAKSSPPALPVPLRGIPDVERADERQDLPHLL